MTRKLNRVLLALLIIVGAPFAWLLLDTTNTGAASDKTITMAQLRTLAGEAGVGPAEVRYVTLGHRWVISDMLAAGSGLRPVPFVVRAYQLVWADGRTATIDRGMDRATAEASEMRNFDPLTQASVERAVASADTRLMLEADSRHGGSRGIVSDLRSEQPSVRHAHAAAPSVVVIPADTIAPGKRMIYVRLADGRELLFAGDVAPVRLSWAEQRPPARLVTTFLSPDDRDEIAAWLRAIARLKRDAPALEIVPGHDPHQTSGLQRGFIDTAAQADRTNR